jgi:chromosome segregation ATPase
MTQEQITLNLCEVIAEQKQKINQLESSNNYLREQRNDLTDGYGELSTKIAELQSELKTCHETIDVKNDLILACDKLLAEQKETIETLQGTVKSMDLEYQKLAAEYNALS